MQTEYSTDFPHSIGEDIPNAQPETIPEEDVNQIREQIRAARTTADLARDESAQSYANIQELRRELQDHGRKANAIGRATAIVLIALVGACAYGYSLLHDQNSWLAQLPGVQKSLDSVAGRMTSAENQVRSLTGNWEGITARVSTVERNLSANLKAAKDFATQQASATRTQVMSELDNRTHSIDAKLMNLESSRQDDRKQMAALEQEVANVRSEAIQRLANAQRENTQELESVRRETDQNRVNLDTVSGSLERKRVEFEVSKKQTQELVPGLAFTVLSTNVSRQRVDGYLHLIPEGNILWVRDQGIQQPMLFHHQNDKRPYEVVFTRISSDGAVGYLLMPNSAQSTTGANSSTPAWATSAR